MFTLTSFVPGEEPPGIIRMQNPIRRLGLIKDVDGQVWDIAAIQGNDHVCACKLNELHPYYGCTTTDVYQYVYQMWKVYNVLIV